MVVIVSTVPPLALSCGKKSSSSPSPARSQSPLDLSGGAVDQVAALALGTGPWWVGPEIAGSLGSIPGLIPDASLTPPHPSMDGRCPAIVIPPLPSGYPLQYEVALDCGPGCDAGGGYTCIGLVKADYDLASATQGRVKTSGTWRMEGPAGTHSITLNNDESYAMAGTLSSDGFVGTVTSTLTLDLTWTFPDPATPARTAQVVEAGTIHLRGSFDPVFAGTSCPTSKVTLDGTGRISLDTLAKAGTATLEWVGVEGQCTACGTEPSGGILRIHGNDDLAVLTFSSGCSAQLDCSPGGLDSRCGMAGLPTFP